MHSSYDEIRRLAFRALDGANAPAGIDEDSGHGTAWLEAAGLPGLTILADAIDTTKEADRSAGLRYDRQAPASYSVHADGRSCVFFAPSVIDLLNASAAASDSRQSSIELLSARHPVFLVSAAARFCPASALIELQWDTAGQAIRFAVTGRSVRASVLPDHSVWTDMEPAAPILLSCREGNPQDERSSTCAVDLKQHVRQALLDGLEVDAGAHSRVAAHAAKIWVPETDASRERGAGAGLTDND